MKKSLVDFMVEQLGGIEAVQKKFEATKPVTLRLELPQALAEKVQAESVVRRVSIGLVIQDALREYFDKPAQRELPVEAPNKPEVNAEGTRLSKYNGSDLAKAFDHKARIKATKTQIELQEATIFTFLTKQKGRTLYSHEVAEHFPKYSSLQVSRTLRRLLHKNKIKKVGQSRGTKYFVRP